MVHGSLLRGIRFVTVHPGYAASSRCVTGIAFSWWNDALMGLAAERAR
ncbi:MAG: hypothetical protein OZSIB_1536 [Candidatus Ozemobacter sibiricus]|uniref:Uncharacterized protein n=1 Tax=Candidatus Ozemobacter sibiricus TaxID=2268124 RepID=A0A367ZJI3_9BACT|nr:MAG: hypothetical protein OZSIB_1536 [Candidatus Ozemobacter sibiricus]